MSLLTLLTPAVASIVGDILTSIVRRESHDSVGYLRQLLQRLSEKHGEEIDIIIDAGGRAFQDLLAFRSVDLSEDQEFVLAQCEDLLALSLLVRATCLAGTSLDEMPSEVQWRSIRMLSRSRFKPWRVFADCVRHDPDLNFLKNAEP